MESQMRAGFPNTNVCNFYLIEINLSIQLVFITKNNMKTKRIEFFSYTGCFLSGPRNHFSPITTHINIESRKSPLHKGYPKLILRVGPINNVPVQS